MEKGNSIKKSIIRSETPELRGLKIVGKIDTDQFKRKKKSKVATPAKPLNIKKRKIIKTAVKKSVICIATNHAYKRAKERLSWKKSALNRMMKRAFVKGIKHSDTKGQLNKYITDKYLNGLYFNKKPANNPRIYGENIYFFNDNLLITVYRLPNKVIKLLDGV